LRCVAQAGAVAALGGDPLAIVIVQVEVAATSSLERTSG
jgi:hypothetical protein